MDPQPNTETPYVQAFQQYWDQGWRGVLPLPPRRKKSPPTGYTGYDGAFPSYADALTWIEAGKYRCETQDGKVYWPSVGNICLRLPADIIGIDVDAYGDKTGGQTLRHAEQLWGPLPPTVRTTARDDPISGIRLFRIPAGTPLQTVIRFPAEGLGNIEVIQYSHRYAVVWPSIHPDTGRQYRWLDHLGLFFDEIPAPGDLPGLPPAWLEAITAAPTPEVTPVDVGIALSVLPKGSPDKVTRERYEAAVASLRGPEGSRHDTVLGHVLSLLRAAEQGHPGVDQALIALRWEFLTTVTSDGSRSPAEAESEWNRMVAGPRGHALIAATPSPRPDEINAELRQLAGLDREQEDNGPPGFWESRPELARIRRAAHAQVCSPWGVLGAVLLRVAALIPYWVTLPDVISGVGSLNVIVCLVAPSGGGKDSAMAVAERVYPAPGAVLLGQDRVYAAPMGTGEGFVHQFVGRTARKPSADELMRDGAGLEEGMFWIRRSVLLHAMEVDTAKAISLRDGSTLLSTLRTLYSGGTLGAANATPEKRLPVPKHSYRACVALGVQPEHGDWILADQTGGLPQRCLWMPCTDPTIPEQSPGFPEPIEAIRSDQFDAYLKQVQIPEEIADLIRNQALLRNQGIGEALDGHALFTREKIAYLLAVLSGRTDGLTLGDWDLAGQVMEVSDTTRARVQAAIDAKRRGENRARAKAEAEREVIKVSLLEEVAQRKIAVRVQARFAKAGGSMSRKTFNDGFNSASRKEAREALERLIETGRIRVDGDGTMFWNET